MQLSRAREPILAEIAQTDRWQSAQQVDGRVAPIEVDAIRLAKQDLLKRSSSAAETVAARLVDGELTQELVDSAVNALMQHDGVTGRKARKKATTELEFHLLCTLFWMTHQTVAGIQEALTWSVGEFIEEALFLPERPRTVKDAVVVGVKDAFADELASEAVEVFLENLGFPSADQLRLLAVMFCPNSNTHREIRLLEKQFGEEIASASIEAAILAAQNGRHT